MFCMEAPWWKCPSLFLSSSIQVIPDLYEVWCQRDAHETCEIPLWFPVLVDISHLLVCFNRDQLYKISLPGESILGDYFQEIRTSGRPFLLLRISFMGRPIFIQLPPAQQTFSSTCSAERSSGEWAADPAKSPRHSSQWWGVTEFLSYSWFVNIWN